MAKALCDHLSLRVLIIAGVCELSLKQISKTSSVEPRSSWEGEGPAEQRRQGLEAAVLRPHRSSVKVALFTPEYVLKPHGKTQSRKDFSLHLRARMIANTAPGKHDVS